jgi:LysR family transcriptional regulator, hypochlorite-specific transcription factor HypT
LSIVHPARPWELKLIEDLMALRRCGGYVCAAERHVTHPAFGRRIRSLEAWAGVPLVEDGRAPIKLTAAGDALLAEAAPLLGHLASMKTQWQMQDQAEKRGAEIVRIGTGRTLARNARRRLADAPARRDAAATRRAAHALDDRDRLGLRARRGRSAGLLRASRVVEHLSGQRLRHFTLASDRLLPVAGADAQGRVRHALDSPQWIGYAPSLSLGRLLADHLSAERGASLPPPSIVCDSADAGGPVATAVRMPSHRLQRDGDRRAGETGGEIRHGDRGRRSGANFRATVGLRRSDRSGQHTARLARIFHRTPVEARTALPFESPFIEVSNLDERAGNAEAKLYRGN